MNFFVTSLRSAASFPVCAGIIGRKLAAALLIMLLFEVTRRL